MSICCREPRRSSTPLPADRWAVVTSATRRLAEARLGEAGIRPKTLVTADDITRGKPDPEPFLLAARQLGVDPARCVVFEDAPAGLQAGRAAGMTTVALTTTHRAAELDADVVAGDLSAVSALVTSGGVEISVDGLTGVHRCPSYGQRFPVPRIRLLYFSHDHDEQPHPCDRGDHDARCSLYVSNVRLLEGPRTTQSLAPRSETAHVCPYDPFVRD